MKTFERILYSACILLVTIVIVKDIYMDNDIINIVYTIFSVFIIIYHIIISDFKFDVLRVGRFKGKNFETHEKIPEESVKRYGSGVVIIIFLLYLSSILYCWYYNLVINNKFFIILIVLLLLLLNNFFKYQFCLIRLFTSKKVKCCADCYLVAWDNIFIFSIFIFVPYIYDDIYFMNKLLIWIIVVYAVMKVVVWEWMMELYPERFQRKINKFLSCDNCSIYSCHKHGIFRTKTYELSKKIISILNVHIKKLKEICRHNYILVGLMLSALLLIFSGILVGKEYFMDYYIFFIVIFFEIPLWPIIYKWIEKSYDRLFEESLLKIFDWGKDETEGKKAKQMHEEDLFRLFSLKNMFIFICINIIIHGILYYLVLDKKLIRFEELEENKIKLYILFMIIVLLIAVTAKAVVILYNAFQQLRKMALERRVKVDYYLTGYKHYIQIKKFSIRMIIIITLVGISLVVCIINSPIGEPGTTQIYRDSNIEIMLFSASCIIATMPTVIAISVYYYLNEIKRKMQEVNYLKRCEEQLEKSRNFERIEKLMGFRDQLLEKRIGESKDTAKISVMATIVLGAMQLLIVILDFIY